MERFASDLFSPVAAGSDRLRLLQWALYSLVRQLDEEGAYSGGWIDQSATEISQPPQQRITQHERQLRQHLVAIKPPTSSLSGLLRHRRHVGPGRRPYTRSIRE